jgi:hypothetical protein
MPLQSGEPRVATREHAIPLLEMIPGRSRAVGRAGRARRSDDGFTGALC